MLYSEIIAVCSQIHTQHINTLCRQNVEFLRVKPGGTYSDHWALKGWWYVFQQESGRHEYREVNGSTHFQNFICCRSMCYSYFHTFVALLRYWRRDGENEKKKNLFLWYVYVMYSGDEITGMVFVPLQISPWIT
jgi:hypothetical protein